MQKSSVYLLEDIKIKIASREILMEFQVWSKPIYTSAAAITATVFLSDNFLITLTENATYLVQELGVI